MDDDLPAPIAPTLTAHLFGPLGDELLALLRSLPADAWRRPTVCRQWSVQDIAAHLLDTALRRLSFVRDAHAPPPPATPIAGYPDLVAFLDGLNADWVKAMRRLSPRLITDLLACVEPQLAAHLATIDPWSPAPFAVAWAGETASPGWFDVARELTERWLHQQQIRLAVGAPPLAEPELSQAIFDTFLRALPRVFANLAAPPAATATIVIRGQRVYSYTLERGSDGWQLLAGATPRPTAALALDEQSAWLLLTKGMPAEQARARATLAGDTALLAPFFGAVAIMG